MDPQLPQQQQTPAFNTLRVGILGNRGVFVFSVIGAIVALGVLATIAYVASRAATNHQSAFKVGTQAISLQDIVKDKAVSLDSNGELIINGQLRVNNALVLTPQSAPIHPTTGQVYLDKTSGKINYYNGHEFSELGAAQATQAPQAGVSSLQGQTGAITLTAGSGVAVNGTSISNTGVLSVGGATGVIGVGSGLGMSNGTLTNTGVTTVNGATGQFSLGKGLAMSGNTISSTVSITSLSSTLTVGTDGNGNFTVAEAGSGVSGTVALGPASPQVDVAASPSISVNKTAAGDLIHLAFSTADRFVVDQTGRITAGTINYAQIIGTPSNLVPTLAGVSGDISLGQGLSISGNSIIGSGVNSLAGTANQVTVTPNGNGAFTLSLPQSLAVASSPTFANLTLSSALSVGNGGTGATNAAAARSNLGSAASGANSDITSLTTLTAINNPSATLTIGNTGQILALQGTNTSLSSTNGAGTFTSTLSFANPTANATITIPNATGTVCLTTGNCLGGGTGGANSALSNLSAVALNTSLLPGATTIDLGSNTSPFRDIYFGSTATNNFKLTGSASAARTITLPDATGTVCLTTGNCAGSGGGIVGSGTLNAIARFTGSGAIGDSLLTQDAGATTVTVTGALSVTNGLSGNGSLLTNLNAGNISTGTLVVANGGTGAANATNARSNLGAAQSGVNGDITSLTALTAINPSATLTIGNTGQILALQGTGTSLSSTSGGFTSTLSFANPGANATITIPNATGTICLTSNNCGSANTALSNLSSVALNTSLLPGTTTIDLGSPSAPFRDLYLGGAATNNFKLIGSATGARTLTLPDSSGTICLSTGNCPSSGVTGSGSSNTIALFTGSTTLGNSLATQNAGATILTVTGDLVVTNGLSGSGASITALNASNVSSGTLTGVRGGTGLTTAAQNGQLLIGNGTNYTLNTLTPGTNMAITNSAGGITLDATSATAANTSLSNLSSVAINTNLQPGGAGINLGSGLFPFATIYLGAGANSVALNTTTTAARAISLPDASGTICLQNASACGFAASVGSGSYIQNQIASQQATTNYWISGTARNDTNTLTPALDTATSVPLNIGTATASALNIGQVGITTTAAGTLNATGNTVFGTVGSSQFTNNGSTVNTAMAIANKPAGGAIGAAAATVDVATSFNISQTTASQTLILPSPTSTVAGRLIYLSNIGSADFTISGTGIPAGSSASYIWNGSTWTIVGTPSVVSTVGAIDGQTKVNDGAVIAGNSIYLQSADSSYPGIVTVGSQTLAGAKTLTGVLAATVGEVISGGDINLNLNGTSMAVSATGGTITTNGAYTVHTFTSSGTFTSSAIMNVEVLVVGGGGGGGKAEANPGGDGAGGGGAGGLIYNPAYTVSTSPTTVTVGGGGAGTTSGTYPNIPRGTNGANSVFGSLNAIGGGGGSSDNDNNNNLNQGANGGSGGGASNWFSQVVPASSGTPGQGNAGGDAVASPSLWRGGSGGGGAGAVGVSRNGTVAGAGGAGSSSTILNGSSIFYAGGGGGGAVGGTGVTAGAGGSGGGGAGGASAGTGVAGTANTGGGGGGGGSNNGSGGNGGSGIVIVRYLTTKLVSYDTNISTGTSTGTITIGGNSLIVKNTANSTTALQIQNSAATTVLNVDTTNKIANVGAAATYLGNTYAYTGFTAKVDYTVGSTPWSIVTADVNSDGKQDIIIGNQGSATVSVLTNNGNGTFAAKVDYATGTTPAGITTSDVNGDGKQDIIICNSGSNTVSVLMNNGNNTFATQVTYATGTNPSGVTAADVNSDGSQDIILVNNGSNTTSVLLNNGNGTFAAKADYATAVSPIGVAAADVNNDGKADIVATNFASGTASVLMNNGNGTYAAKVDYSVSANPKGVKLVDVNSDGKNDLVVTGSSYTSILMNNGNGTFAAKVEYANGGISNTQWNAIGDFNGDGKPDITTANYALSTSTVFINNGNGTFAAAVSYAVTGNPGSVATADFNGDGYSDIVTANSTGTSISVLMDGIATPTTLKSNLSTTLTDPAKSAMILQAASGQAVDIFRVQDSTQASLLNVASTGFVGVGIATPTQKLDVNGNINASGILYTGGVQRLDSTGNMSNIIDITANGNALFKTTANSTTAFQVQNTSGTNLLALDTTNSKVTVGTSGTTQFVNNASTLNTSFALPDKASGAIGTAAATVNIYTNFTIAQTTAGQTLTIPSPTTTTAGRVIYISNIGSAFFTMLGTFVLPGATASFEWNGTAWTITGISSGVNVVGAIADSYSSSFAAKVDYTTGSTPYDVTTADVNSDGYKDVITANSGANTASVLINNGNGTFATKVDYATGTAPQGIASGDVNGDGKPDIIISNSSANTVSVLINNGNGTFAAKVDYATSTSPLRVNIDDVNSDGYQDIITANSGTNTVSVLINNGNGTFSTKVDYATSATTQDVTTADVNSDGKPDIITANWAGGTSGTTSVLINNGNGTFAAKVDYSVNFAWAVTTADVNGDGKPDIVIADLGNFAAVLINNGNGTFAPAVYYAAGTNPEDVTTADVNGDGRPDIIIANWITTVSVFINSGNGIFAAAVNYTAGSGSYGVTATDLSGDGKQDIITANRTLSAVSVFINNSPYIVKSLNGATIQGNTIYMQTADYANGGLVTAAAQTLAGAKALTGVLTASVGQTINGGAISLNDSSNFATNINTGTSTGIVTLGGNGVVAKNTNDTTTSFQIQNATSSPVLNVDSTNKTMNVLTAATYAPTNTGFVGGTQTQAGDYAYHTFTSNGSFTASITGTVEILIVAGGGGGGSWAGGGGGAGGLVYEPARSLTPGTYTVVVGGGGGGGVPGHGVGYNGANSSFTGSTSAIGGGGGGGGGNLAAVPTVGGSGGGGAPWGTTRIGAAGTAGQGSAGGNEIDPFIGGGGGGGAGAIGSNSPNSTTGGGGGNGLAFWDPSNGTSKYYAGGGGGGGMPTAGAGGLGGGGAGSPNNTTSGVAGTANTGGGGGGAAYNNSSPPNGGAGGSGVVIVRYLNIAIKSNISTTISDPAKSALILQGIAGQAVDILRVQDSSQLEFLNITKYNLVGIGLNTTDVNQKLDVNGNVKESGDLYTNGTKIIDNAGNYTVNSLTVTGNALLIKPPVNSTTAFQVQNASSNNLLAVDNANNIITVGTAGNSQFVNSSSTLNNNYPVNNLPGGGTIGTAVATVDNYTSFTINQTSAGQTITIPAPTNTTAGRVIYIANIGSATYTISGNTTAPGVSASYIWNGTAWATSDTTITAGIQTVGVIDSQTKSSDGGVIVGTAVYFQNADATYPGLVSAGTQTIAGAKTLTSLLTASAGEIISGADINLNVSSNFATNINTGTSTGIVTMGGNRVVIINTTNSTTALQVQNSASTTVLGADTTNKTVNVGVATTYTGPLFGTFIAKVDYATGSGPNDNTTSDVNGDGQSDIITVGSNTASVLMNNGNGTFATKVDYTTGTTPYGVTTADVNGDSKPDIIVANYSSNTASVLTNNGNGTFAAKVDYTTGSNPFKVTTADVNGDGKPDIITANTISNTASVLINNGNGTFATKVDYVTGTNPRGVAASDVNGDGKLDIITTNQGSGTASVLINNGNGTFATKVDYTTGSTPYGVTTTDVNGDGKPDIIVTNYTSSNIVSVFINNGNGTFATKVDYATGSSPNGVTNADVNGDGKPDIIVANNGSNTASVLMNNGNGTFAAKVDYATGVAPYSVAAADINSDGKPDIIAANNSSNTASVLINGANATLKSTLSTTLTDPAKSAMILQAAGSQVANIFRVQDSTGANLMNVDSTGNVGIGVTGTPSQKLDVNGSANFSTDLYTSGVKRLDGAGNLSNIGDITANGSSLFKTTSNSTTALQIQKSDSTPLFTADTTNMKVTVAELIVTNNLTFNGHFITGGTAPTIAAGAAACTTPTVAVTGNDTAGNISITTGTGCAATGTLGTITFNTAYASAPKIKFTPTNANAVNLKYFNANSAAGNFTLDTGTIPANTTVYTYNYWIAQ